jgi:hypothetical protein
MRTIEKIGSPGRVQIFLVMAAFNRESFVITAKFLSSHVSEEIIKLLRISAPLQKGGEGHCCPISQRTAPHDFVILF